MSQSEFPKWVQRAPYIGPVLILNAKEEQQLITDWDAEQLAKAEEDAASAKADAAAAQEAAQVVLKGKGK